MDKRDDTRREVLLDVCNEPITSIDALVEQCHRALSAQLWVTCCWPEGGSNWKIGDYNSLVVSVEPDEDTSLYVQFWSEPRERVWTEIVSGDRWCPGAIRYIGSPQRNALEARGYARGGRAGNFERELVIDSPAEAEAAALEVLQIFFEVFGYRGQWRLNIERHRGERADHRPVYTNVTPEDFAKVATRAGYQATVTNERRHAARGPDTRAARIRGGHGLARREEESLFAVHLAGGPDAEATRVGRGDLAGQFDVPAREGLAHRHAHGPPAHAARAGRWRDGGVAGAVAASLDQQLARMRAAAPARCRAGEASPDIAARRTHSLIDDWPQWSIDAMKKCTDQSCHTSSVGCVQNQSPSRDSATVGGIVGMDANIRRASTVNAATTVIDAVRRVEFGPLTTFRNLGLLALSTNGDARQTT